MPYPGKGGWNKRRQVGTDEVRTAVLLEAQADQRPKKETQVPAIMITVKKTQMWTQTQG